MGGYNILLDPNNIARLFAGLGVSMQIALASLALSIVLGIAVGMLMTLRNPVVKWLLRFYVYFVRIMPQLVLLFIVFFGTSAWIGLNLDGFTASVVVFTLWGTSEIGDLVRGSLESIPQSQYDSAHVLGLSRMQTFVHVILPQAARQLIPPIMNLAARMIMTTSLCMLIGVVELMRTGSQIIDYNRFQFVDGALWIYGAIFFMYFLVCFPLSMLSRYLEKRIRK